MIWKNTLMFFFILSITKFSHSQSIPADIATKFFDDYKKESLDKAIDNLFATNKYSTIYQESIDAVKHGLNKAVTEVGKFYGYELLSKKTAGSSVVMLTFIAKYEKGPLTFRILFYNPGSKWQVQNFKFDNKIDDELEEASQSYRLKENY